MTCTDCRAGCPVQPRDYTYAPEDAQPAQETAVLVDGVFIRTIGPMAEGTLVPQHSHVHDHTTVVAAGAVRAWQGEVWLGDFAAGTPIFIKAGVLHRFQVLADATLLLCVHNTVRTGEVEELEPGRLIAAEGEPDLEPPAFDGITIQEEPWERFWRDGQVLIAAHDREAGPRLGGGDRVLNLPMIEEMAHKHAVQVVTARCNGRMAGYLVSFLAPCVEVAGAITAAQTAWYADPDFRGIGPRLLRMSHEMLREKGVSEVMLRARPGSEKSGALYRRLGAVDAGHVYLLKLEAA